MSGHSRAFRECPVTWAFQKISPRSTRRVQSFFLFFLCALCALGGKRFLALSFRHSSHPIRTSLPSQSLIIDRCRFAPPPTVKPCSSPSSPSAPMGCCCPSPASTGTTGPLHGSQNFSVQPSSSLPSCPFAHFWVPSSYSPPASFLPIHSRGRSSRSSSAFLSASRPGGPLTRFSPIAKRSPSLPPYLC